LVDCSTEEENRGCKGGFMNTAFKYLMKHPLMRAKDYPYTAVDGKCMHDDKKGIVLLSGYRPLPSGDVKA